MMMRERIIVKTTLSDLPLLRDRYPFLYLEHGRLEIDDSSVKWISADGEVFRLPAAVISTLLLGPGTSVTHEAVKILASLNCTVCWVGEDSFCFYAVGESPTATSSRFKKQMQLASDPKKSLEIARKMFQVRFPNDDISGKTLTELMMLEGSRVKLLYSELAQKYFIHWGGRSYKPGEFQLSDLTNQLITAANAALYALTTSIIYSLGLSPRLGFVHSGSPLPFVYDVADLYKKELVFDLAFSLTRELGGIYDRQRAISEFRRRVIDYELMKKCPADLINLLGLKK